MKESINVHLSDRMPIDRTRNAMGIGSEDRKELESSGSPFDDIWQSMKHAMGEIEKDIFFGFLPNPATP